MERIRIKKSASVNVDRERVDTWVLDYNERTVTAHFSEGYQTPEGKFVAVNKFVLMDKDNAQTVLDLQDKSQAAMTNKAWELLDARRALDADTTGKSGAVVQPDSPTLPRD